MGLPPPGSAAHGEPSILPPSRDADARSDDGKPKAGQGLALGDSEGSQCLAGGPGRGSACSARSLE
eukprot:13888754-Alexandrium_andersonii.AAC.1